MFSRDSIPRSLRPLSKIFPNSISSIVRTYTVRELTVVYAATWIRKKNGGPPSSVETLSKWDEYLFTIRLLSFRFGPQIEPIKRHQCQCFWTWEKKKKKKSLLFFSFKFYRNAFTNFYYFFLDFYSNRSIINKLNVESKKKRYFDLEKWLSEIVFFRLSPIEWT